MTGAAELMADLRRAGIRLWLEDGRLRYRAPKGAVTPDRLAGLREREAEIRAWLETSTSHPIARVPDQPSHEASHAQRRLWVLHQLHPGSAAYHVPLHQLVEGPVDRDRLAAAVARLVERHESLRTTFVSADGEPRQVVHRSLDCPVAYHDLSGVPDPEPAARRMGRDHAAAPFDLESGPLLRVALLRLGARRHVVLFTVHHIVSDGVSIEVVARELDALYADAGAALPTLGIQYRDFTAWQNRLLAGERGGRHREYWHAKLGGTLPVLDLLDDLPRPAVLSSRGRTVFVEIGAGRTARLADLGRRRGVSLFMVLLAALKTLLHRYTGQTDIVVGSPSAGRHHPDLEGQVGFYLNTLALRDTLHPDLPFEALLERVSATATEAYEHQDYPFEVLVDELPVPNDPSRSPLFDVMMIVQNRLADSVAFGGWPARSFFEHTETAKVDLSLNFKETDAGLLLEIEYGADVFVEARIRHLADHFVTLLDGIVAAPARPIGRLPLLPDAERRLVIHGFNDTAVAYPGDRAVIDLFEARAALGPDAPAARHRERTVSYRELDALADRLAHHLRDRGGLGPGHTAVLALPSGIPMLAALLGVLKLRGAAVLVEPSTPAARQAMMLEESRSRLLVTETRPAGLAFDGVTLELGRELDEILERPAEPVSAPGRHPDDTVLVFFTSGSTGRPKGVPLTNRGIVNEIDWFRRYFEVGPADVLPQKTVLAFVDCIVELLLPITLGGCVELRPDHDVARDGGALFRWFRSIRPTILQFVPAVWDEVAAEADAAALESLRALILSGGTVTRRPAHPFRVYNLYGCSECTSLSTYHDMTGAPALARVPIGRPLQNTTAYVLDADMEPCPVFVPGELYVGGDMVAAGYLGQPALTAERFVPSPFRPGERLFRTGDHARWLADGSIDYLGRRDDQVKVRGVRVECGEVERALRQHPGIREAVVAGRPTAGGDTILAAYVVPAAGASVSAADLRGHLARTLPEVMIPSALVVLDALPRTASGKIDRRALPEPAPAARVIVAPRDETEAAIAGIWRDVLGLAAVGVHDDFLALGGHSLKATRVVARIERDLGVRVSLVDVFRHPTIAELADVARAGGHGAADRIRPVDQPEDLAPATEEELEMLLGDSTP